jgi:ribosomal protein S18 acetylase RimI-like enzyme
METQDEAEETPVRYRELEVPEYGLLAHFTYLAIHVPEGVEAPPPGIVFDDPHLSCYFDDFGDRAGDIAMCAEATPGEGTDAGTAGEVVGIAWCRVLGGDAPGYGHWDEATPEVALAVAPEWRGHGIGTRLLDGLCAHAARAGWRHLSLSVQRDNRARHLYARAGFRPVQVNEEDLVLLRDLP